MTENQAYQSPFSWRYGSPAMREIWSEYSTRLLWRKIWVALAEAQVAYQLVTDDQLVELKGKVLQVDLDRSFEIETSIHHDLMAELQVFAEQCPHAGGVLHLGATSMDIKDNTSVLQQKQALIQILKQVRELLAVLAALILDWLDTPVIGFTHLQPAEPLSLGYRLAQPAQDLLNCYQGLQQFEGGIKSKGFTGAVGSSASFASLIGEENLASFQKLMSTSLELDFFDVVSQTYPRLQDFQLLSHLAGLGAVLYKFAFDLRILQSPGMAELAEPFGTSQVGSSAMPFKQNPIKAEKINSLGRYLAQLPRIAWDNAAHSLLERTLDDSANRRIILPEAFLSLDEMLETCREVLSGLQVNVAAINRNLDEYQPFAAIERLLMLLCKAGADRQKMHSHLRNLSNQAWAAVKQGQENPLLELVSADPELQIYLSESDLREVFEDLDYLGDTRQRAQALAIKIQKTISS